MGRAAGMALATVVAAYVVGGGAAQGSGAGVAASMSAAGGQYVVDAMLPVLQAKISSISVPGVSGKKDGFDYSLSGMTCNNFVIGGGAFNLSPSGGVTVGMSGLGISCSGSWSFKLSIWPHLPKGSGTVSVSMGGTSASVGLGVTAAGGHPVLAPHNVGLSIGSLNIAFHGSLWDWLLNIFRGYIASAIKSAISAAFQSAITQFIASDVNAALAAMQMVLPLHAAAPYNIAEARFGLTANPTFTTTYAGVGLQGDIVPLANPVSPPITPPALPPFNAATGAYYLQMQLSSYTFDSAAYTYHAAGLLHWLLQPRVIPLGFNNTAAYALVAPGLPAAYPGATVSIAVDCANLPTLHMTTAGINATAPLTLQFQVATPNGTLTAFTLGALTSLAANLHTGTDASGALALQLTLSYLGAKLSVVNTAVGTINAGLLQTLVDMTLSGVVVPLVNGIFANGIPLPSMGGVTPVHTLISYGDEFVTLASDFTINPALLLPAVVPRAYTLQRDGSLVDAPAEAPAAPPVVPAPHPASRLRKHISPAAQ